MKTNNANSSNLTKYGYDMVAGVSHVAINQTLKRFLDVNVKEKIICYVMNPEGKTILVDYEQFKKENGIKTDLFTLPEKSKHEDLEKAADAGFVFAMKTKYGWNKQFGNVVNFVQNKQFEQQKVYYRMFYKECQILFLKYSYRNYTFFHKTQNPSKPWIFTCKVNIDIKSVLENESISQKVKEQINNMGDDMFSIEQLYLDLNSTVLHEGDPEIIKDIDGETLTLLKDNFINIYLKELKEQHKNIYTNNAQKNIDENRIVLGHVAKEKPGQNASSSLLVTPKEFKLCIHESGGSKPEELYTLNYLIMAKKGAFPPLTNPLFNWNWVDETTAKECSGYMAIKRSIFVDHLKNILDKAHEPLMFNVNPGIKNINLSKGKIWINPYQISSKINYVVNTNEEKIKQDGTVLTFKHEYKEHDESLYKNEFDTTYSWISTVSLIDNKIRVKIYAKIYGCIQIFASAWGDFAFVESLIDYEMKTDDTGKIIVTHKILNDKITSNVNVSLMMKIGCTNIEEVLTSVKSWFKSKFEKSFEGINQSLVSSLNNTNPIVFMGDQTFFFKKPTFSENKDLLVQIIYKDPEK